MKYKGKLVYYLALLVYSYGLCANPLETRVSVEVDTDHVSFDHQAKDVEIIALGAEHAAFLSDSTQYVILREELDYIQFHLDTNFSRFLHSEPIQYKDTLYTRQGDIITALVLDMSPKGVQCIVGGTQNRTFFPKEMLAFMSLPAYGLSIPF